MKTWWERAEDNAFGIVAYLCYNSSIRIVGDGVKSHGSYVMRLPYSRRSLRMRSALGGDLPDWWEDRQDQEVNEGVCCE
jgi:hypothetical protein